MNRRSFFRVLGGLVAATVLVRSKPKWPRGRPVIEPLNVRIDRDLKEDIEHLVNGTGPYRTATEAVICETEAQRRLEQHLDNHAAHVKAHYQFAIDNWGLLP